MCQARNLSNTLPKTKKALKSNITDNESAKMKTSHGVAQGHDGVAMVDSKYQVLVSAEAFGEAQEHYHLKPMVDQTPKNFEQIGEEEDIFEKAKLTADSGFHTEKNMEMLSEEGVDGRVCGRSAVQEKGSSVCRSRSVQEDPQECQESPSLHSQRLHL